MSNNKVDLNRVLTALDQKNYDFYSKLSDEEKKSVTLFLLNRYMSVVKGNTDIQVYYLMSTNKRVNRQYFSLAKHPDLIWKMLCTASPGMGKQYHQWVGKKKSSSNNKKRKQLEQLYPDMTDRDMDVLESVITDAEIRQLIKDTGE